MNPLFMQMIMNSIGMGCMSGSPFMMGIGFGMPSLFCCGSNFMTMPFSSDDNLWFLNSPIVRDTSYDFLLDPNLAAKRCRMNWQNGNMFGTTVLPGFDFPAIGPVAKIGDTAPKAQKSETEKENEKKKAKEKDNPIEKRKSEQADKLNETFKKIQKLAENKDNKFRAIPDSVTKKVQDAMSDSKTGEEKLAAMKEAMSYFTPEELRRAVLADDTVRENLRKAGYNFNLKYNKYSTKNENITDKDVDSSNFADELKKDIENKVYTKYAEAAGLVNKDDDAKDRILGLISTWNSKNNSSDARGIIRYVAKNLSEYKIVAAQMATEQITDALIKKAKEYDGYTKIDSARKNVEKLLQPLRYKASDSLEKRKRTFTPEALNKLANACDALYARLRMQEAVTVKNYVTNNFGYMNEIQENVVTDNMIIDETMQDLEAEGIKNYPKVNDLDQAPISDENDEGDEEYTEEDFEAIDQFATDKKIETLITLEQLTPVTGQDNIYQTKALTGGKVRYFGVFDDNIYECKISADGKVTKGKEAEETPAVSIGAYNAAVERANTLTSGDDPALNQLEFPECKYPLFKETGAEKYYIIINDGLFQIDNCKRIYKEGNKVKIEFTTENKTDIEVKDLKSEDLNEFKNSDLKTAKKKAADDKKEAAKVKQDNIDKVAEKYTKRELPLSTLETDVDSIGLKSTGVKGYYTNKATNEPKLYFVYDKTTKKMKLLKGVTEVRKDGTYVQNGTRKTCTSFEEPIECGKALHKAIAGDVYTHNNYADRITGGEKKIKEDLTTLNKQFNTFANYKLCSDIINFLIGFNNETIGIIWDSSGLAETIVKNKAIPDADKRKYIKLIANRLNQIVELKEIPLDNDDDYTNLRSLRDGKDVHYKHNANNDKKIKIHTSAIELDRLMKIIIDKYLVINKAQQTANNGN